jgi:hypothetical protein
VGSRLRRQPIADYRKHQEGKASWCQTQSWSGIGNLRLWMLRSVIFLVKLSFYSRCVMNRADDHSDHFLEDDIILHSWECLSEIIQHPDCQDILLDVGMPVKHKVWAVLSPRDQEFTDCLFNPVCQI